MRTLLIIGFGDIARRALPQLTRRWRVRVVVRSEAAAQHAHALGVTAIRADLDQAPTLQRLAGIADAILYCAPPNASGLLDKRIRHFLRAQAKANSIAQRIVYISTSAVYGDAAGRWCDETAPLRPSGARGWRRVDAEQVLVRFARTHRSALTILRAPGIYAAERLPLARIAAATPCIVPAEDSWTNHIHADDLARLCVVALERRHGIRRFNACDDRPLRSGDWFDALATHYRLPAPPRLPRVEVARQLSPAQWSFLSDSRRLSNRRLHDELAFTLRWPSCHHWLALGAAQSAQLASG